MSLKTLIEAAQSNTKRAPIGQGTAATYDLEAIQPRGTDTRPINPAHVDALMHSIAVLGLIEPLAIDRVGRLLAGGHRLAAIHQLKEQNPAAFQEQFPDGRVPVRVMEFDAEADPSRALEIEIAENEQRRDYTPAEVRAIADRLREEGYRDSKGRPKAGEKALTPALQVIIGKSRRTVISYLAGDKKKPKNVQHCAFLKRALKELEQWEAAPREAGPATSRLQTKLAEIKKMLDDAIVEMDSSLE